MTTHGPSSSAMKTEEELEKAQIDPTVWKPVKVKVGGKKAYHCPDQTCPGFHSQIGSYYGMDSHIRKFHTLEEYQCGSCVFTTYNYDLLLKHEKKHRGTPPPPVMSPLHYI